MCLAVPMRVVGDPEGSRATVEAEGVVRVVDVSLVEGVVPGDYLIVHAGFAIEKLDVADAEERIELFREMARLDAENPGTEKGG
ncbi:MAG: HypC/HybG/HupF family hydrogenase formation chaperone [Deltaproteobacteria bacterium]|nr:HypC/HybG/HupF family hydrogenase formation chaperone [Deltaproteobacteria bacterium]